MRSKVALRESLRLVVNLFFWLPSRKIDKEFFEKPLKIFYTVVVLTFIGAIAVSIIRNIKGQTNSFSTLGMILSEVLLILTIVFWNKLRPSTRYLLLDTALTIGISISANYSSEIKLNQYKEGKIDAITSFYDGNTTAWFSAVMIMLLNNRALGLLTLFYRILHFDGLFGQGQGANFIYVFAASLFFIISCARRYFEHRTFRKINNLFQEQTDHLAINNILEEGIVIIKEDRTLPFSNLRAKEFPYFSSEILPPSTEVLDLDTPRHLLFNHHHLNSQIEVCC